jgi:hypothetical protein
MVSRAYALSYRRKHNQYAHSRPWAQRGIHGYFRDEKATSQVRGISRVDVKFAYLGSVTMARSRSVIHIASKTGITLQFYAFGVALPHLQTWQRHRSTSVHEDQHPRPPAHLILENLSCLVIIAVCTGI